jgi:uncharacterized Rossmann fold enzyme
MGVERALEIYRDSCDRLCGRVWSLKGTGRACILTPAANAEYARKLLDSCDSALVADSAASLIKDIEMSVETIIVTDLDGGFDCVGRVASRSRLVAVHVHGDNTWLIPFIKDIPPWPTVIVTSQVPAPQGYPILAPFGFTDADRAFLLGLVMGYEELVVPWSFRPARKSWSISHQKATKLRVALSLIEEYASYFGYTCRKLTLSK